MKHHSKVLAGLLVLCAIGSFLPIHHSAAAPEENNEEENPKPWNMTYVTDDGFTIVGTYTPPKEHEAPSVILLHMLGRSRSDWQEFSLELQDAGYAVLAIDFRGHGDSIKKKDKTVKYYEFENEQFQEMILDVEEAKRWLHGRVELNTTKMAIVGGSIGANIALNYAAAQEDITALALLSPGLDYRGVTTSEALDTYADRPIFFAAAENDAGSAQAVEQLYDASQAGDDDKTKIVYPDDENNHDDDHGTAMFASHQKKDLPEKIIGFLDTHMK